MKDMAVPRIDDKRLWADLMALGEIGFAEGRGVTRTALSEADLGVWRRSSRRMGRRAPTA